MEEQPISIFPESPVVYANFGQRFLAFLLDAIILAIPGGIIQSLTGANKLLLNWLRGIENPPSAVYGLIAVFVMQWIYFAAMESSHNQATIGKIALGIVVTDTDGKRISFGKATGRYFAKFVSGLILFIGYLMNTWDPRGQTLHDKMANALVIRKPRNFNRFS